MKHPVCTSYGYGFISLSSKSHYFLLAVTNHVFPGFITGYCMSEALILSSINRKYHILDEYSNLY